MLRYNHSSSINDEDIDDDNDDHNDDNDESKDGSEEDQDSQHGGSPILKRTLSRLENNNPSLVELNVRCKSTTKELATFITLHLPNSTCTNCNCPAVAVLTTLWSCAFSSAATFS